MSTGVEALGIRARSRRGRFRRIARKRFERLGYQKAFQSGCLFSLPPEAIASLEGVVVLNRGRLLGSEDRRGDGRCRDVWSWIAYGGELRDTISPFGEGASLLARVAEDEAHKDVEHADGEKEERRGERESVNMVRKY